MYETKRAKIKGAAKPAQAVKPISNNTVPYLGYLLDSFECWKL